MPLVQHNHLPSIERVRSEGIEVYSPNEVSGKLPCVKIGFLNMMPDAAVTATERQFLRLVGANLNVNCYFYPFNIDGVERSNETRVHTDEFYSDFAQIKRIGMDALVITGANVVQPLLPDELFWDELTEVLNWARDNVRSTMCSCLATHAAAKFFYNVDRTHLGDKCWGLFAHEVVLKDHPLLKNIESKLLMCHSRFNDISFDNFTDNNVKVLIQSEEAGVQLATEAGMKAIYFQGHPEYDDISLLKEYKREIIRYLTDQRENYPPTPANYFNDKAFQAIDSYKDLVQQAKNWEGLLEQFPETILRSEISNPWKKSAQTIFSNWLDFLAS